MLSVRNVSRFVAPDLAGLAGDELCSTFLRASFWWRRELRHVGRRVWLYGSVARGQGSSNSDIDLLVDTALSRSQLAVVAARLSLLTGRQVHLLEMAVLEVDPDPSFIVRFRRDAVRLRRLSQTNKMR